jgi:phosphate transport system permease protein
MNKIRWRITKDKLFKSIVFLLSITTFSPLVFILYFITKKGIKSMNLEFFTTLPNPPGEPGGGIANALTGTIVIVLIAAIIAIPIGLLTGIFLNEYRKSKISTILCTGIDVLMGTPSIVFGIIAYIWIVKPLKSFSAISGSIALAIMMLPIIIKSTEETLKLIPKNLKEASLALGVPNYRTILRVVLPASASSITNGILLSIARVSGETAPLLFTSFGNSFFNINILKPMDSLPLLIFNYATSPYDNWINLAWGASLVLIILVLVLNIISRIGAKRWKVKF